MTTNPAPPPHTSCTPEPHPSRPAPTPSSGPKSQSVRLPQVTGALTRPSTPNPAPAFEQGPLVPQPPAAARLAAVLVHAAEELWDAATLEDTAWMWEEARAIASRILASCPVDGPQPIA